MQLHLEDLRRSRIYRNGVPSPGNVELENANDTDSSNNSTAPLLVHMHSQELQLAEGPQFIGNVLVVSGRTKEFESSCIVSQKR